VVREAKPERWEPIMGSIAETLIERGKAEGIAKGRAEGKAEGRTEGRAEGRAEGKAEGKAEGLFRLLTRRFGPLPHELERQLAGASVTELDVWLDNFLEAPSLEAVFGQAQT